MLNIKSLDLRSRLASDAGENSIMQTITIAVSAILIAAGLITAPGLINNARDNNARGDLSNFAYAEEYNLANFGVYDTIDGIKANVAKGAASTTGEGGGIKFTSSDGVKQNVDIRTSGQSYYLVAVSASGNVYATKSSAAKIYKIGKLDGTTFTREAAFTGDTEGFAGADAAAKNTALEAFVKAASQK